MSRWYGFDTRETSRWYGFDTRETSWWYGFDTREALRWYGFDYSCHAEMVWFWSLVRRMVWFGNLVRRKRLRDINSKKIVWFGFLVRSWYDFGSSWEVVSWWPTSWEVIIPWGGYPNPTWSVSLSSIGFYFRASLEWNPGKDFTNMERNKLFDDEEYCTNVFLFSCC